MVGTDMVHERYKADYYTSIMIGVNLPSFVRLSPIYREGSSPSVKCLLVSKFGLYYTFV